jgi:hypothetical protein
MTTAERRSLSLGLAAVLVVLAGVAAGGLGLMAALVALSVVAWVWKDVPRLVAVFLTVVTVVLALAVMSGLSVTTSGREHGSSVSHHVGDYHVPPPP